MVSLAVAPLERCPAIGEESCLLDEKSVLQSESVWGAKKKNKNKNTHKKTLTMLTGTGALEKMGGVVPE